MSSPGTDRESSSDNGTKRRRLNEAGNVDVKQERSDERGSAERQEDEDVADGVRRHGRWYDASADMEVATSDQVVFKLHSYMLQTWS